MNLSKKSILIYSAYNKGVPASVVARAFSCTEEDVYAAIVCHAIEVDKVKTRHSTTRTTLKDLLASGFPIGILASYYEMPEERFLRFVNESKSNVTDLRERFLFEYSSLIPRQDLRTLAKMHRISYFKACKWVSESRTQRRVS